MKRRATPALSNEKPLISRAQKGDKEAYRDIVEAYKDRLFGMVLTLVPARPQAEDLVQEIFVKVYFALPKFTGDSAFYTWMFRIATNHCLDHLRRRKPPEFSLDAPIDESETMRRVDQIPAPESELPDRSFETPSETGSILASLSEEQRAILTLRELEGHSYEELAVLLNCNINTIKSRLNRAREALKIAFVSKYGNISAAQSVEMKGEPST